MDDDDDAAMDEFVSQLTQGIDEVVLPEDTEDVSDYWLLFKDHLRVCYLGTPETFAKWQKEQLN